MTDDELERRKEETWGMNEVRGDSLEREEPSDTADTTDSKDTAEVSPESDAAPDKAAGESAKSKSDTADTTQPEDTTDSSDTQDTAGSEVTVGHSAPKDTSDTSDMNDTSPSKERPEGATVRQMALDAETKELAVRDLRNVNVYLYDDIHQEMVSTFKTLDAEYYQTLVTIYPKTRIFSMQYFVQD